LKIYCAAFGEEPLEVEVLLKFLRQKEQHWEVPLRMKL